MSSIPFRANDAARQRFEAAELRCGEALRTAAEHLLNAARPDPLDRNCLTGDEAAQLMRVHQVSDIETLMLLIMPLARRMTRPAVSDYEVGAVGREAVSGALLLGGNIEILGSEFGLTIHGETCLAARAFSRGDRLSHIALREAHPCGHCRQFLTEFAGADRLRIIDPLGHELSLSQLLPWPFDPGYLGQPGAHPAPKAELSLALAMEGMIADRLIQTACRAHAPYGRNPAAVAIMLAGGACVTGAAIENVAFNPSMGPMQVALINLIAAGFTINAIRHIHLAECDGAALPHALQTQLLRDRISPGAGFTLHHWQV